MEEIMAGIASLKAAREAEYEKMRSDMSKEKYESKITAYKLKSAIKHEAHVRSEKTAELQTQLSTLHLTVSPPPVFEK